MSKIIDRLWLAEYSKHRHCCLCGNYGFLDTRGKVFTPAGKECGDLVYCICPNGRKMKELGVDLESESYAKNS